MEEPTPPTKGPTAEPPRLPRLRIIHLMLWTACTGGLIALGEFSQQFVEVPENILRVMRLRVAMGAVFSGLAVAGTIALLTQGGLTKQIAFRFPGHWLLCQYAIASVATRTLQITAHLLSEAGFGDGRLQNFMLSSVMVSGVIVLVAALLVTRPSKSWKVYLIYAAVCQLTYAALFIWISFASVRGISAYLSTLRVASSAGAVFLLIIGIYEWQSGLRRDWLHKAGIVAVVGSTASSWLMQLLQPLLMG